VSDGAVRFTPRKRRPDEKIDGAKLSLFKSEGFPNASLDAVAVGGSSSVLARDEDSQPRRARRAPLDVKGVAGYVAAYAPAQ